MQNLVNDSRTSAHKPPELYQLTVHSLPAKTVQEGSRRKSLFVLFVSVFVTLACATQSMAQDYRRFEIFAGYSHNRVDVRPVEDFDPGDDLEFDDIFDEREGFNGFNASVVGNFHRYWGGEV